MDFTQADVLEHLTITSSIEDIRIIHRKSQNCSIAYVDFDSKQAALEAKNELNLRIVNGRKVYAEISKPPSKDDNSKNTIFVNNLPYGMKQDDLVEGLQLSLGDLVEVRIKKAYAFVKFKEESIFKKEMKRLGKNGVVLKGRRIIFKDASKKKGEKEEEERQGKKIDLKAKIHTIPEKKEDKEEEIQDIVVKKKKKRSNKDFKMLFGV